MTALSLPTHYTILNDTGIGLEVHEDPYLRGGNDLIIKTGHTFSDEPGVYIEGKVSRLIGYTQSPHAHKTFRSAYA